jgi:hypothetical protein
MITFGIGEKLTAQTLIEMFAQLSSLVGLQNGQKCRWFLLDIEGEFSLRSENTTLAAPIIFQHDYNPKHSQFNTNWERIQVKWELIPALFITLYESIRTCCGSDRG